VRKPLAPRPGRDNAGRRAQEDCEKTPRSLDTRQGSLGTPAMPAACCGARPAPWPLSAGSPPGCATRSIVQTGQRACGAPRVGGDHACHGALLGLSLPQAASPPEAPTRSDAEGSGWRGSYRVSIPVWIKSGVFSMADAVIDAKENLYLKGMALPKR
jgi:hypothetical protein